jgi:DNA-binding NtrC family response regulator
MKVLIVDDDESTRLIITKMLGSDHQTTTANNGKQALEILQQERFDVVITDFQLDYDLTGEDVAKTAKELHPETRVLLISGYAREIRWADKFLPKPFHKEEILQFIGT